MKKRLLSALLVSVMAMSLVACGGGSSSSSNNESKKYNIGICQLVQHEALDAATKGFKDALIEELGEDNVEFNEQNAQGDPNTCSSIINDFTNKKVDLILANATPALQAAASATDSIPILGTSITEYGVALDIDNFSGTVGKNISGTSDLAPLDKQAEMLKEIFPDAKKVGLLFCSAEPNSKYQVDTVQTNLEKLGYTCTQYSFQDSNELSAVATTAVSESDVIYVPTDNTVANNTELLYNTAIEKNVPVVAGEEGICKGCGTVTLSISYYDLGVATGKMAAKVLKGEKKIEEMPIEYAPNFTKKYNKAICEKLNIKVPEGYEEIKE